LSTIATFPWREWPNSMHFSDRRSTTTHISSPHKAHYHALNQPKDNPITTIMLFFNKTSFFTTTFLLVTPILVGALSDEDLIEMHGRLLSEEDMEDFHRELNFKNAWSMFKDSTSTTFGRNGQHGGGRGFGAGGQRGRRGGQGGGGGLTSEEMRIIDFLLDNRFDIDRSTEEVTKNGKVVGMELVTTSNLQAVAGNIKKHVHQMKALVEAGRWVRQRDPLYAALLGRRKELSMEVEDLSDGVLVTELGESNCAVELIKGHSEVVDGFIDRGRAEVRANHPVPPICLN